MWLYIECLLDVGEGGILGSARDALLENFAALVRSEAVEKSRAARGLELILAATARAVRGVPGLHVPGVLQPHQVVVADDRRALAAFRPVAAGGIAARRRVHARRIRAREDV